MHKEGIAHSVIAGAIFDFLGFLTSRDKSVTLSRQHDVNPILDLYREWADSRGLDLRRADVFSWNKTYIIARMIPPEE